MNCGCKSTGHEPGCFMLTATNLHPYSDAPASDQQVTTEQALADALQANQDHGYPALSHHRYHCGATCANGILATEPMQTIARQAAIGAAVERLGDDWWVEHGNGRYSVTVLRGGVPMGFPADTLDAAIAAALEATR